MISDFQPREFAFGFAWVVLSDADLKKINDFIADKSYMEKDAAKILQNGIALKNICQGKNIFLWCCLSMLVMKINKDIGSMVALFYKWKTDCTS